MGNKPTDKGKTPAVAPPRIITVKELGPNLPIGFLRDGKLDKSFELRPYKSRIDRHLNAWIGKHNGEHAGKLVCKFLSMLVCQADGEAVPLTDAGDSLPEQELKIHNWNFGDVMYAYLYSRIKNVGEQLELPYVCGVCGNKGYALADLESVEVRVIDNPNQLHHWVTLRNGIKLHSGRVARKLKLKPVNFATMFLDGVADSGSHNTGYAELRESVCEVDCEAGPYTLTDGEIDDMDKIDQLAIDRQANVITAGPDMRTNLNCTKSGCEAPIRNAFDWTFSSFFDSSVPLATLTS